MYKTFFSSLILFFGLWTSARAQQDCSLGIGITPSQTLVEVFQLRTEQKAKLEEYQTAVLAETELIDEERKALFEANANTPPEELKAVGVKYQALEAKMKEVFRKYDLKMLALLNEKQYQRYVSLCREVSRRPLVAPKG